MQEKADKLCYTTYGLIATFHNQAYIISECQELGAKDKK